MKKFLASLLSVVLALSVFALVGCDKKSDLKMTEVLQKIDLSKGVTVTLNMTQSAEEQKNDVAANVKVMTLKDGVNVDFEGDVSIDGEKSTYKAYVRGTDAYISNEENAESFYKISLEQMAESGMGLDVNSLISILTEDTTNFGLGNNFIDSEVVFYKKGAELKAEVDIFAILVRELKKINGVIDILDADTTVKQIYDKLEGDKLLDKLFGDIKGKDFYKSLREQIVNLDMPTDMLPPEVGGMINALPTEVDAFIKMINAMNMGITFPEMGDKTLSEYFKEFIKEYNDKTLFELSLSFMPTEIPEEQKTAAKEELVAEIENIKKEAKPAIEKYITGFEANKCIFTIIAQDDGSLSKVAAEISVDSELAALLGNMGYKMNGIVLPDAVQSEANAFTLNFTAEFNYDVPQFTDVSKLSVVDLAEEQLKENIIMVAQAAVANEILTNYEKYGEAENGYYATVTITKDGVVSQVEILTEAPEDNAKFTEKGVIETTENGYAVYLLILPLSE